MMATTNITIRIDADLKKEAEELYEDLGVTFTTVLVSCIKQSVREQRIPFKITRNVTGRKRGRPSAQRIKDETPVVEEPTEN